MSKSTDALTTGRHADYPVPVKRARVTATVEFDAWVIDYDGWEDAEEDALSVEGLAIRVEQEVADAIEYHAGHLNDTDPGDALVALVRGGEGSVVSVTDLVLDDLTDEHDGPPEQSVNDAVEHTSAWLS